MIRKLITATLSKLSFQSGEYAQAITTFTPEQKGVALALTYTSGATSTLNEVQTVTYAAIAYTKDIRPQSGDKIEIGNKAFIIDSVIENARYRQLNLKADVGI